LKSLENGPSNTLRFRVPGSLEREIRRQSKAEKSNVSELTRRLWERYLSTKTKPKKKAKAKR